MSPVRTPGRSSRHRRWRRTAWWCQMDTQRMGPGRCPPCKCRPCKPSSRSRSMPVRGGGRPGSPRRTRNWQRTRRRPRRCCLPGTRCTPSRRVVRCRYRRRMVRTDLRRDRSSQLHKCTACGRQRRQCPRRRRCTSSWRRPPCTCRRSRLHRRRRRW